jgi:hypothetical protein
MKSYFNNLEFIVDLGPSWSWSYSSWIYYYLCNQCPSLLTLCVWIPLRRGVLKLKVCQWRSTGRWFSPGTLVASTNKTYIHGIAEILLDAALNTQFFHQGTAWPSRAPGFTPVFGGVHVAHLFNFLCCVLFVFVLCLVYPLLPVSLDCPFLIVPSVFSNVYC